MGLEVRLGGWEHGCCGEAVERDQFVELGCVRVGPADGIATLFETHHGAPVDLWVRGRVTDIFVVRDDERAEPVDRVPSGRAISGNDPHDDGHLEQPWTGERVADGHEFLVIVQTPEQ